VSDAKYTATCANTKTCFKSVSCDTQSFVSMCYNFNAGVQSIYSLCHKSYFIFYRSVGLPRIVNYLYTVFKKTGTLFIFVITLCVVDRS